MASLLIGLSDNRASRVAEITLPPGNSFLPSAKASCRLAIRFRRRPKPFAVRLFHFAVGQNLLPSGYSISPSAKTFCRPAIPFRRRPKRFAIRLFHFAVGQNVLPSGYSISPSAKTFCRSIAQGSHGKSPEPREVRRRPRTNRRRSVWDDFTEVGATQIDKDVTNGVVNDRILINKAAPQVAK
jgi:hypothetical protein